MENVVRIGPIGDGETGDEDEDRELMREAAPGPIDRVLDLLPPIPDTTPVRAAAMTIRPYGTVVLMGGIGAGLELPYRHLMRNCITIRGQFMYPRDAPLRLIQLARAGLISLRDAEITAFSLADANAAVEHAAANGGPFKMTVIKPYRAMTLEHWASVGRMLPGCGEHALTG